MNPAIVETQFYLVGVYISLSILLILLFWDLFYVVRKKNSTHRSKKFFPRVSVIIPAHNEASVLPRTLQKIFSSNYPKRLMEVIVVDDGSTDGTAKIAKRFPVKLIRNKTNIGKCSSLNIGIENARNEILITTDADTEFEKNTIENLAKHFSDDGVGAVTGFYKAIPMKNIFTNFSLNKLKTYLLVKFQSVEYLTFLLTKKRQAAFDALMVVSGSIGAFRKDVLEKIGGFDSKMLVEDYEATIRIHKAGYRVVCEKDAVAWTKPPLDLYSLFKQRLRWYRGGFQVLSKHTDIFSSRHGFVPIIFAFEYLNIFLQIAMFAFVGGTIYERIVLLHQNLLMLILNWFYGLILFKPVDMFGAIILSLFFVGLAETYVSIKMTKDSLKNILLYPISTLYLSFLGLIWLYSLVSHLIGRKINLKGNTWKSTVNTA